MSPKVDRSEERREQILDAATNVFARQGFHKARMDDIVQEAGLSKGAVYWYFESKDEIIDEIFDRFFSRELEGMHELVRLDTTVSERLFTMATVLAKEIEEILGIMPIAYELYAVATRQASLRRSINKYFQRYLDVFEDLLREGIRSGEFRAIDTRVASINIIALFEGLILLYMVGALDRNWSSLEGLVQSGLEIFIEGLKEET